MKSLMLALIVVANFYFIESVNANCNPTRRLFGKASGCTDTIIETSPSTDNESHFAVMPHDYEAERRQKQEQLEIQRREQLRIEQQQYYYRQQQYQQEQMRRQQAEQQRQADQQRYDQFGNPVGVSTHRFTIPAN